MNAIKKIFVFLIVIFCVAIVGYKIYEQIEKKSAEPDFLVTINDTLPDGQSKKARYFPERIPLAQGRKLPAAPQPGDRFTF